MLGLFCLTVWKMHKNNLKVFDSSNGLFFAILMFMFAITYLFVLGVSYIFSDPRIDLISRTFLPVHIAILLGVLSSFLFFIRAWPSARWLNLIPIFLSIGISISYLNESIDIVKQYHQYGSGYTSTEWRDSEIIRILEQIPSNIPIISNDSALVLFYTGRTAYDIFELINAVPQDISNRYGDDPNDPAQKAFRENGAALVLFRSSYWQFEQLYGDQTIKRMEYLTQGLFLYAQAWEGTIYFYPVGEK
jgi:hypothetical protein